MKMTSEETREDFYRKSIKDMIDGIENIEHLIGIFYYIAVFWQDTEAFRKSLKDTDED